MNVGVILSGGSGVRFGADKPKQYCLLNGREVISYVVGAAEKANLDRIVIAAAKDYLPYLRKTYKADAVEGGDTRNKTVDNALRFIRENCPECRKIIFMDAARPLITAEYIDGCLKSLDDYDGVITAAKITDSLGKEGQTCVDRSEYYLIQTPEAFRKEALKDFDRESGFTAIVQQLPPTARVYKDYRMGLNLKITYPSDLKVAEIYMAERL